MWSTLFKYFAETLERWSHRGLAGCQRRRHGRQQTTVTAQHCLAYPRCRNRISCISNKMQLFSLTSPAFFLSCHIIVTPSAWILKGPLPDQSNSVLRRFGHHNSFLRIAFYDESRSNKTTQRSSVHYIKALKSMFHKLLISLSQDPV